MNVPLRIEGAQIFSGPEWLLWLMIVFFVAGSGSNLPGYLYLNALRDVFSNALVFVRVFTNLII